MKVFLSFCFYAWMGFITCIHFPLFIQLALCFILCCFIHESLWENIQGRIPEAGYSLEVFSETRIKNRIVSDCRVITMHQYLAKEDSHLGCSYISRSTFLSCLVIQDQAFGNSNSQIKTAISSFYFSCWEQIIYPNWNFYQHPQSAT